MKTKRHALAPRFWLAAAVLCCTSPGPAEAQTWQEKVVAAVLVGEAGNQGRAGMVAVGEVIHTRSVQNSQSPVQVVTAGRPGARAFSCMTGLSPEAAVSRRKSSPVYGAALAVARIVCRTPWKLPGVTRGATHFTRKEEKPYWAAGRRPVAVIGAHAFYRIPK